MAVQGTVDSIVFDSCKFGSNYGVHKGGAIYFDDESKSYYEPSTYNKLGIIRQEPAIIRASTFGRNTAQIGGGIYYGDQYVDISGCMFQLNSASLYGGAIAIASTINSKKRFLNLIGLNVMCT